nr:mediator of rna polymerase ii transcription subunit 6 [Quercus suber]
MNPECLTAVAPAPGTDMTGICFKDQLWLNTYPLDRNLVFDYFALSPFYDWTCNNEQLRMRSIHPLDLSHLSIMNFESDGKGVNCPRAQKNFRHQTHAV